MRVFKHANQEHFKLNINKQQRKQQSEQKQCLPLINHNINAINTSCFRLNGLYLMLSLIILILLTHPCSSVVIKMKKQYIYVPKNSNYTFKLDINQTKSQINPLKIQIYHQIYNTLATTNQYFDYFKYLSKQDISCYQQSIGNGSYLYPCPFILNNDTVLRVFDVEDNIQNENQLIRGLNQIHQHFIVDNTPYPFPNGAYPYSQLWISSSTSLTIAFDQSTKNAGIRLIFITVTLLLIYGFVIGLLVFRTKKIQRQMQQRKPDYQLKRRPSQLSKYDGGRQQDQQSDIDNYDQFTPKQLFNRDSLDARQYRGSRNLKQSQDQQFGEQGWTSSTNKQKSDSKQKQKQLRTISEESKDD